MPTDNAISEGDLFPPDEAQALEWLLVLAAMQISYALHRDAHQWVIRVAPDDRSRAQREITLYRHENKNWPPCSPPLPPPVQRSGWSAAWVMVMLISFYAWFGPYAAHATTLNAAVFDARLIRAGEWWRTLTALGVHADLPHLAGNAVAVLGLGAAVATTFGGGAGWLSALVAAGAANLASALFFDDPRVSLGASTVVFSLLGMLAAQAILRQKILPGSSATKRPALGLRFGRARPAIGATLALFSLLGAAPHSDVRAHLLGLICGIPAGMLLHAVGPARIPPFVQRVLEMGALFLFMMAWRLALTRANP